MKINTNKPKGVFPLFMVFCFGDNCDSCAQVLGVPGGPAGVHINFPKGWVVESSMVAVVNGKQPAQEIYCNRCATKRAKGDANGKVVSRGSVQ